MISLSECSHPTAGAETSAALHERVLLQVASFFLNDIANNPILAHQAARQMLLCYKAATDRELQLSAQIVACGMAALDCLRCAMSERSMPGTTLLRIQGNAVTLNNMGEKSRRALDACKKGRHRRQAMIQEAVGFNEAEFQAAIGKAAQMTRFARTSLEAYRASAALSAAGKAKPSKPSAAPSPTPRAADPVTPEMLERRRQASLLWARDLAELPDRHEQTRH